MKILIVRVSAIGDVIHTLPALFLLKKQIPSAQISWIVQKKAAALLSHHPALDRVWVLPDKYLYPAQWKATAHIMRDVKATTWDVIIDFQGILKTSLLIAQLKGKKYGFGKKHARSSWTRFFTHHHIDPQYTNIIQKNLSLAAEVVQNVTQEASCPALHTLRNDFNLFFSEESKQQVLKWLSLHKTEKIIALCPNTTWASKLWPTSRWQELLTLLCSHFNKPGDPIIARLGTSFTGEAAEKLLPFIQEHKLPVVIVPKMDLLTTACLFTHAALVIAPDTGLLHIADFLGIPSLGIFGPTSKKRHGPFLTEQNVKNCIQVECPHHYQKTHTKNANTVAEQDCMYTLTSKDVLSRVVRIIQGV